MHRNWYHAFAALVLCGMFALTLLGHRDDSPTEDEWAHVTRGIAYWQQSDTRLHYSHPPLANAISGLPLAGDPQNPNLAATAAWKQADVGRVALEYLKDDYPAARARLMRARIAAMLGFGVLLAAYVYFFCWTMFGPTTAVAATVLIAFNPTVIAQARYVTTDLAVACAATIAVGEFVRYLVRGGRRSLWVMSIALAAAVLTKHSGLLLVPFFLLIGGTFAGLGLARYAGAPLGRRLARFGLHTLLTALVLVFAINLVFKFDRTGLTVAEILAEPEPAHWIYSPMKQQLVERYTPLPSLPQGLRIPLPVVWIQGVAGIRAHNERGFPSYFMGEAREKGHLAYFPTLLLIKSPPALLLLLLLALVIGARRRMRGLSLELLIIIAVATLFLLTAMRSQLNMGIRHALPVIPLASIVAGRAFAVAWGWTRGRDGPRVLLVVLLASTLASALAVAPLYLGYFNLLVGSVRGHDISIYGEDWGQDRVALAATVRRHGIAPLYYDAQTVTRKLEVDHLGMEFIPLACKTEVKPGSWVAIHAFPAKRNRGRCYPWMAGRTPILTIHEHIYLYWIPAGNAAPQAPASQPDLPDDEGGLADGQP